MLRETSFQVGGILLTLLSALLLVGLLWAGAGWIFFEGYVGVGAGLLFAAFFLMVARESRSDRRALHRLGEISGAAPASPPSGPPGR